MFNQCFLTVNPVYFNTSKKLVVFSMYHNNFFYSVEDVYEIDDKEYRKTKHFSLFNDLLLTLTLLTAEVQYVVE